MVSHTLTEIDDVYIYIRLIRLISKPNKFNMCEIEFTDYQPVTSESRDLVRCQASQRLREPQQCHGPPN